MMHSPIQLQDVALSFPHKICFEGLTTQVCYSRRIAIIGQNGCGKSTLLKILHKKAEATSGRVFVPADTNVGYVPQIIECFDNLSGGQRLNKALTQALALSPNVLLLDEPTNHLDIANRKSLIRMLNNFEGTLIVVSHDLDLLRNCVDSFWHIEHGQVQFFSGSFDDYVHENHMKRKAIEDERMALNRQKKEIHQALMKEQSRASKSRAKGEKSITKRKWPTIVSKAKFGRGSQTSNKKQLEIAHKKQALNEKLSELHLTEILTPKFSLNAEQMGSRTLVTITKGSVGYHDNWILCNINLSIAPRQRIALMGSNGSGKSTLIRAMIGDQSVSKVGNWDVPKIDQMGYLDQHYETLCSAKSVLESIQEMIPLWDIASARNHLKDFLFRKCEEVNAVIATLSGGEKARLALAHIAAKTPKLLILDEVTNNLDLIAREHLMQVLQKYPGAILVISHDEDFLRAIDVTDGYRIEQDSMVHFRL